MALIALADAKRHLRIEHTDLDADIDMKLLQAEAIVVDRINASARGRALTAEWTESTLPLPVQAAMLLMLTHLWENRGDYSGGSIGGGQPDQNIWRALDLFLVRYNDPAIG